MTYLHLSDPDLHRRALEARRLQGEAITRAAYLAFVGIERGLRFVLRVLADGVGTLYRRIQHERRRRLAVAELQRLDERLLRDIGITRGEIVAVVEESLANPPRSLAEIRHLPRPSRPRTGGGRFREAA